MSGSFTTTPEDRYFEDYVVGAVHEFGSMSVDEKDVIGFGRRSESRPDRGIVHSFVEVLNQKLQVVMSLKAVNFVRCREAESDIES